MLSYTNYVESMARDGEDKVFFNSGPNHAAIVMSRIFKYSRNIVRIYCGGFDGTVSNDDDYLFYLHGFLTRGGAVKILAQEDLSQGPGKIFKVLKKFQGSVEMYKTFSNVIDNTTQQSLHFMIGDDKMLRLETGISNYAAQVNFGNKADARIFIDVFDEIFNHAQNKVILI